MDVCTYLYLGRRCEEAVGLYQSVLGAQVTCLVRFSEAPPPLRTPGDDDLVFHSTLALGETRLNLSDDPTGEQGLPNGFAFLVHVDEFGAVERIVGGFAAAGGQVIVEPGPTPWTHQYGIVRDPFGVIWKVQFS